MVTLIDITERKLVENALEKSRSELHQYFENDISADYVVSLAGEIFSCNKTFLEMFGFENKSHTEKFDITQLYKNPADRLELIHLVKQYGRVENYEVEYLTKDGKALFAIINAIGIFNVSGELVQIRGYIVDITKLKLAEKELRESEEFAKRLIDSSNDCVKVLDLDGNLLSMSKGGQKLLEIKDISIYLNQSWVDFWKGEDRNAAIEAISKAKKGDIGIFSGFSPTEKGTPKWWEIIVTPINDTFGKAESLLAVSRDITERKKEHESLLKLSHAVEQSPVSIVITDKNGNIEYGNPKVTEITGYKPEELIGKNPRIFKSGEKSKSEYKIIWETISSGKEWFGEFHNKKKNCELYWEYASLSPIMNEKGEITHYVAVKEDITARKLAEIELIKAKEKAEESDHLKTAFLANMSHEIRTPMNSIMGFASLLPEEESKELMTNYTNIIVSSSEHLLHIIDDIVLYSKLQTKLISYVSTQFNIQELLSDIKQSFNLPEFHKGVELKIETETIEPTIIHTDSEKLRQIFINLISNAFKYTSSGTITIGFNQQKNEINFFVKDTGIGIPKNELEKVFERFYRGTNVTKGIIGGTGLGLSIVKELMQLLGGRIWAERNTGLGSSFYFTIPYES